MNNPEMSERKNSQASDHLYPAHSNMSGRKGSVAPDHLSLWNSNASERKNSQASDTVYPDRSSEEAIRRNSHMSDRKGSEASGTVYPDRTSEEALRRGSHTSERRDSEVSDTVYPDRTSGEAVRRSSHVSERKDSQGLDPLYSSRSSNEALRRGSHVSERKNSQASDITHSLRTSKEAIRRGSHETRVPPRRRSSQSTQGSHPPPVSSRRFSNYNIIDEDIEEVPRAPSPTYNPRTSSLSALSAPQFLFPTNPTTSSRTAPSKRRQDSVAVDPFTSVRNETIPEDPSSSSSDDSSDSADSSDLEITLAQSPPNFSFPLTPPKKQSSPKKNEMDARRRNSSIKFSYPFDNADGHEEMIDEKARLARYAPDPRITKERRKSSCVLVNRRKSVYTIDEEKVVRAKGKKKLRLTRNLFIVVFILANSACIIISWVFPKYWWVFAPVILLGNVMNSLMVVNIVRWYVWGKILQFFNKGPPEPDTTTPTTIAMVLACYCEDYQDLMDTLVSLNTQKKIDHHKKMFIIICDGQVKGKGMEKSTDRILVEDILKPTEEHWFPTGYESWDGAVNGIYASSGIWEGTPYVCLVKKRNLGKRDGLILVRTLLYKYKLRYENPVSTMGEEFFRWFSEFSEDCGIDQFEWLVGVDADTTFNDTCIYEMHKECMKSPELVGCSGLIQVGFRTGKWNLWNIYQNTEYIRAQCLRRWHQAHGTGKVSCLPGACQIIKIVEETCGDTILIALFGILPDPKANMILQVRALAGEDRNYICLIFQQFPKAQTTMSLNAIAYTDPPNGLMVFLSQRKRWTLSTCANDFLITQRNEMNWFERICSFADILTWVVPIFVAQTLGLFIKACYSTDDPTFIICFSIVTMIPLSYGLVVTYWGCETNLLRAQYLLGFLMVVLIGQFVTPVVICYAIWHMDDFSWGKTREIEVSDDPDSKPAHSD